MTRTSLLVLLVLACQAPSPDVHELGCAKVAAGRTREICEGISASLEWTWVGHASLSLGYKPSFAGIAKVYCRLAIVPADLPQLEALKVEPDWRLVSGADFLVRILANLATPPPEDAASIFNPTNPDYLLKAGCGRH